jgi:ubiquinone/menaquinone biosynthesis C-methylase UbiE
MQTKARRENLHRNPEPIDDDGIEWPKYAPHMDLMAKLMPAYAENLDSLKRHIEDLGLSGKVRVVDLGAGTGIYSEMVANLLPEAEIFHVDFDPSMNSIAKAKYKDAGIDNVEVICEHIQRIEFEPASIDLIVCVNVLYAVQPQNAIAMKMREWLRNDGSLFIIDFGRKQSALDWGLHFLTNAVKGKNIRTYFQFLLFGQQITRQAIKGRKAQERGEYWVHTTEEFGSFLENAGYSVEYVGPCYRGYADLAICRQS